MLFNLRLHFLDGRPQQMFNVAGDDPQAAFDGALTALPESDRQQVAYGELWPVEEGSAGAKIGTTARDVFDRFLAEDACGRYYLRDADGKQSVILKAPDGAVSTVLPYPDAERLPQAVREALRGLVGI